MRRLVSDPARGGPLGRNEPPGPSRPATGPLMITDGPMLCRLCAWTDAEWEALPEARRPARYTRAPGLGWVGAVPVAGLN